MHKAVEDGHLEVIKILAPRLGARVHAKAVGDHSALHSAAQLGHCEVVHYLIDEVKMDPQNRDKVGGVLRLDKMCS